jgi:hypothetical protein
MYMRTTPRVMPLPVQGFGALPVTMPRLFTLGDLRRTVHGGRRGGGFRGFGAAPSTFVAMSAGVTNAQSDAACTAAGGTPGFLPTVGPVASTTYGCNVPTLPSLPGWCEWVPFATSWSSECNTSVGAGSPISQQTASAYSLYKIGQQSGPDAEAAAAATAAQMEASYPAPDCVYQATSDNPVLAQIFGGDLAASLANPFSNCGTIPGWLIYGGAGLALYFIFRGWK